MSTVDFRSLSISTIAVLTFAGSVAAQEKPAGLLNTFEVRQLVKRAEPGDNARLAAHFTALAERYVVEAKRHTLVAQSFVGKDRPGVLPDVGEAVCSGGQRSRGDGARVPGHASVPGRRALRSSGRVVAR